MRRPSPGSPRRATPVSANQQALWGDAPWPDMPVSPPPDPPVERGTPVPRTAQASTATLTPDEAGRLEALHRYEVLDTAADPHFDELSRLAAECCEMPMAVVSLVDTNRVWFMSRYGVPARAVPREGSFCGLTISEPGEVSEVPDASADPRFAVHPLVAGAPGLRFYAGAPLITPDGHVIGGLCVLDTQPRRLTPTQRGVLRALAQQVVNRFELARQARVVHALLADEQRVAGELREKTAMLEAILNTSITALIQLDPSGRIIYANPPAEHLLGLHRRDILQRYYDPPEWRPTTLAGGEWPDAAQPFRRILATGEPVYDVEHSIEWPDGRRRHLSVNGAPIHGADGVISSLVFSVTDITERVTAAEAARKLETQLRRTQKLEALGTLAGGIAHDFNNLLAIVLNNAAHAQDIMADSDPVQESLDDVIAAAERGRDLVHQILTFSRQQSAERRAVRLGPVVHDMVKLLRPALPSSLELSCTIDDGAPPVLAAPTLIHQTLMNLCMNASQAMPDALGHIAVEVTRERLRDGQVADLLGGDYACLTVRDDGRGMDAATAARIFDPFFTTKAPGEGTGLGLSVVDGIVRSHDGAIEVNSVPGGGTTFRIYLPAADDAEVDDLAPREEAPVEAAARRVLLVDDERLLLRIEKRALELHGYAVSAHSRAPEALAAFEADPDRYDVVVADLNMPGLTGQMLTRRLRGLRPAMPVIITSGYITEETREALLEDGVVDVLQKPHTSSELRAAIERALVSRVAPSAGPA